MALHACGALNPKKRIASVFLDQTPPKPWENRYLGPVQNAERHGIGNASSPLRTGGNLSFSWLLYDSGSLLPTGDLPRARFPGRRPRGLERASEGRGVPAARLRGGAGAWRRLRGRRGRPAGVGAAARGPDRPRQRRRGHQPPAARRAPQGASRERADGHPRGPAQPGPLPPAGRPVRFPVSDPGPDRHPLPGGRPVHAGAPRRPAELPVLPLVPDLGVALPARRDAAGGPGLSKPSTCSTRWPTSCCRR